MNLLAFLCITVCAGVIEKGESKSLPASVSLNEFAFDMFNRITRSIPRNRNLVFSPFSAYTALSSLIPGLDETASAQVKSALKSNELTNHTEEVSAMITSVLSSSSSKNSVSLNLTNRIFIDKRIRLYKSFKSTSHRFYNVSIKKLNFFKQPQRSLKRINNYIAKKTDNEIKRLLPSDSVSQTTKMILTNIINLQSNGAQTFMLRGAPPKTFTVVDPDLQTKIRGFVFNGFSVARWKYPFNPRSTRAGNFHLNDTTSINVPFMSETMRCQKANIETLDCLMVTLPFEGESLDMVILMPTRTGNFSAFKRSDTASRVPDIVEKHLTEKRPFQPTCRVIIPKFSIKFKVEGFPSLLKKMGIINIFKRSLDSFSRMTPTENLYVNDVQHGAAVEIKESGVKASAATSITIGWRTAPSVVRVDRPFLFMIRHRLSGATMFMGKVSTPQD